MSGTIAQLLRVATKAPASNALSAIKAARIDGFAVRLRESRIVILV
jgi:hypothetical protein